MTLSPSFPARCLLAIGVLTLAACATPAPESTNVAGATPAKRDCRASTGTTICRSDGDTGNVKVMSGESVRTVGTQQTGGFGGKADKP